MSDLIDQYVSGLATYMYDNPDLLPADAAKEFAQLSGLRKAAWATYTPEQRQKIISKAQTWGVQQVENERLRDALKPFAEFATAHLRMLDSASDYEGVRDDFVLWAVNDVRITAGDLRHAIAAYHRRARDVV